MDLLIIITTLKPDDLLEGVTIDSPTFKAALSLNRNTKPRCKIFDLINHVKLKHFDICSIVLDICTVLHPDQNFVKLYVHISKTFAVTNVRCCRSFPEYKWSDSPVKNRPQ